MSFKDRLKEARLAKNMKQIELSEKIGLSRNVVSNYENGTSYPNVEVLYRLFEILEVEPNYLFQDEINIKNNDNIISIEEKNHLKKYNKLNSLGQKKVNDYIDDLSENSNYLKENDMQNIEDGRKYTNITFEDNIKHEAAFGGIPNNDDNTYTT